MGFANYSKFFDGSSDFFIHFLSLAIWLKDCLSSFTFVVTQGDIDNDKDSYDKQQTDILSHPKPNNWIL